MISICHKLDSDIPSFGLDYQHLNFGFSPDYLLSAANQRGGQGITFYDPSNTGLYIPAIIYKSRFLRILRFTAAPSYANGQQPTADEELSFLNPLVAHIKQHNICDRINPPANWALFQVAPDSAVKAPFGSYCLNLQANEPDLWHRLHQKHRNAIRKAQKSNVMIKAGHDQLDNAYDIYHQTMNRNHMAADSKESFFTLMSSRDFDVFCGVAYLDDTPVSAIFAPYNRFGAYYLHGGTVEKLAVDGANTLLHYSAIQAFHAAGCNHYDFVGARIGNIENPRVANIQRFKSRFGGELKEGVIWKKDIKLANSKLYDFATQAKRFMERKPPTLDLIDQEKNKNL